MKWLLFTLLQISFLSINAQVFVSESHDGLLYFGPENVSKNQFQQASYFIDELENAINGLEEWIEMNNSKVEKISLKPKIKKSDERKLRVIDVENKSLELEIVGLTELLNQWKSVKNTSKLLMDKMNNKNHCYEVFTNHGTFSLKGLEFIEKSPKSDQLFVYFDVISTNSREEWVKVRVKSCVSQNEEDCYVVCFKNLVDYHFLDMYSVQHKLLEFPDFFEFLKEKQICLQPIENDIINVDDEKWFEARLIDTKEEVLIEEWNLVNCSN